ncbi:MAG: hypothetical protein U1D25_16675 [Hydrogenophaga sp.]|uniref:hypothetical protein n=1 Tax=Hydrogenophaga sp. TaxID=1904254 RepID=UPI002ABBD703|nr:hypothetical protein [Hydrogenophaga sp.]MDZ4189720.1 hypothetical protein [Hydrogenophaga sp.]
MKPQIITQYDAPHQFEPLLPADSVLGPLLERSSDLIRAAPLWATQRAQPPSWNCASCCAA